MAADAAGWATPGFGVPAPGDGDPAAGPSGSLVPYAAPYAPPYEGAYASAYGFGTPAGGVPVGPPDGTPGGGPPGAGGFTGGAGNWLAGLDGLRNTVRQELVSRQLDERLTAHFPPGGGAHARQQRSLRVLDIGPGQGTQALRLARAGHVVTGLESDPAMLAALRAAVATEPQHVRDRMALLRGDGRQTGRHFGPACFDVVLCHGVLMYVPDPEPLLAALARVLAPGGLLSLLVRNGDALAMRPGLLGDWAGALGGVGATGYTNRLGLATRADRREPLTATLAGIGVPLQAWYGVRVFTDTAPDGARAPQDPRELAQLLDAEEAAGRTDPYRAVAALLHLCGVRT